MRKPLIFLVLMALCAMSLTSCFKAKEYIYFQNLKAKVDTTGSFREDSSAGNLNSIIIQPFDQLDIKIKAGSIAIQSLTGSTSTGAQLGGGGTTASIQTSSYLSGFQVDANGYITLPTLGNIYVRGLTIKQAKEKLKNLMKATINDPYVDIKFLTFRVTVLGEVNHPGTVVVPNERATLIDLISAAGDLTTDANRKKIKVIRGDPRNPLVYELDITNSKSFTAGYILQPNDIIYIEPLPRKFLFLNLGELTPFLAIANTLLLIYSILLSITKK